MLTALVGQALLFGQFSLLLYAAAGWAVTASFVRWYVEPTLRRLWPSTRPALSSVAALPEWCWDCCCHGRVPWLADRVDALESMDDVKHLDVRLNRLDRWHADGSAVPRRRGNASRKRH